MLHDAWFAPGEAKGCLQASLGRESKTRTGCIPARIQVDTSVLGFPFAGTTPAGGMSCSKIIVFQILTWPAMARALISSRKL